MAQKGFTLWFTGLSASGKTTLSQMVAARMKELSLKVEILDGDVIRENLSKGLGFSKEDRDINILRIGFVCNLLSRNGVVAIAAAISPYKEIRERNRAQIENYVEVFVDAPIEECARRDPKGLYKKAYAGEIPNFTGVSDPYEAPENPEIHLDTLNQTPEESVDQVVYKLMDMGYLPSKDSGDSVYSDEEEETVKKRLEDLGYI